MSWRDSAKHHRARELVRAAAAGDLVLRGEQLLHRSRTDPGAEPIPATRRDTQIVTHLITRGELCAPDGVVSPTTLRSRT